MFPLLSPTRKPEEPQILGDDVDARKIEDRSCGENRPATPPPNGDDQEEEDDPDWEEKNGEEFMEEKHGWGEESETAGG